MLLDNERTQLDAFVEAPRGRHRRAVRPVLDHGRELLALRHEVAAS